MPQGSSQRRIGPLSEWIADPSDHFITESIPQVWERRLKLNPDTPAVYWLAGDGLIHLTYGQLWSAVEPVARALAAAAAPGARVAVWSKNTLEWLILEHAVAVAGVVLDPFNTLWADGELEHAVQLTKPTLLFVGEGGRSHESLRSRAARFAGSATIIDLKDLQLWANAAPKGDLPTVAPEDPFLIQFTSGTTGRPKGATLSHQGALNVAYLRNRADVIVENDCIVQPAPFHHIGASCSANLGALVDCGAVVVIQRWDPAEIVKILDTGIPTRLAGVPTHLIDLLNTLEKLGRDPRQYGILSIATGASQVPKELIIKLEERFAAHVTNNFGQSECGAIASTRAGDSPAVVSSTIGRPLDGMSVKIVAPGTEDIAPIGTPGEILAHGPTAMIGYWEMSEATAETVTPDGYVRTGDLGIMDESGYIVIKGRGEDMIIRGGENINPPEVEEQLLQHAGVAAAALIGIPDDRLGEKPAAVIIRATGSDVLGEELAVFMSTRVARFKIPFLWRFVDEFPVTASGKVQRFILREDTIAEIEASLGADISSQSPIGERGRVVLGSDTARGT